MEEEYLEELRSVSDSVDKEERSLLLETGQVRPTPLQLRARTEDVLERLVR